MKSKKKWLWLKRGIVIVMAIGFCIFFAWVIFMNFISVPVLRTEKEALIYIIKAGIFSIFFPVLLCGSYFYIASLEKKVEELSEQLSEQLRKQRP